MSRFFAAYKQPCGCLVAGCVDDPRFEKETAADILDWTRRGLTVKLVEQDAMTALRRCRCDPHHHHDRPREGGRRDEMTDTLKPCPFCGAEPTTEPWHGGSPTRTAVHCDADDCPANPMVTGETPELAASEWNRRACVLPDCEDNDHGKACIDRLRAELDRAVAVADHLETKLASAASELAAARVDLAAMRPVVEAAVEWRKSGGFSSTRTAYQLYSSVNTYLAAKEARDATA